jgi:hypothetical protein
MESVKERLNRFHGIGIQCGACGVDSPIEEWTERGCTKKRQAVITCPKCNVSVVLLRRIDGGTRVVNDLFWQAQSPSYQKMQEENARLEEQKTKEFWKKYGSRRNAN